MNLYFHPLQLVECYRYFNMYEDILNMLQVCKGFEWLERILFTDDGDILIQGFHTVCICCVVIIISSQSFNGVDMYLLFDSLKTSSQRLPCSCDKVLVTFSDTSSGLYRGKCSSRSACEYSG